MVYGRLQTKYKQLTRQTFDAVVSGKVPAFCRTNSTNRTLYKDQHVDLKVSFLWRNFNDLPISCLRGQLGFPDDSSVYAKKLCSFKLFAAWKQAIKPIAVAAYLCPLTLAWNKRLQIFYRELFVGINRSEDVWNPWSKSIGIHLQPHAASRTDGTCNVQSSRGNARSCTYWPTCTLSSPFPLSRDKAHHLTPGTIQHNNCCFCCWMQRDVISSRDIPLPVLIVNRRDANELKTISYYQRL